MRFDENLTACAALVQRADPDRFMAAMAAPVAARPLLFALYAMNVEVARAPWVTNEPMIAEIRLQWWRDALTEIAAGGPVRKHEVVTPLAEFLYPQQAGILDQMIAVRYWDIYNDPFDDQDHFDRYIDQSSGALIWAAACGLGAADEVVVRDFAWGTGLANWLRAVPDLRARGRVPLVDGSSQAIRDLAEAGLERLARARSQRAKVSRASAPALLVGWQAQTVLKQALRDPSRVDAGTLGQREVARRLSLMTKVMSGRW